MWYLRRGACRLDTTIVHHPLLIIAIAVLLPMEVRGLSLSGSSGCTCGALRTEVDVSSNVSATDSWLSRGRPRCCGANDAMGAGLSVCGQSVAALGFPALCAAAESMASCSCTIGAHAMGISMDKVPMLMHRHEQRERHRFQSFWRSLRCGVRAGPLQWAGAIAAADLVSGGWLYWLAAAAVACGGPMLVLSCNWRRHCSRTVNWYRRERVWLRLVDYAMHGVMLSTLLAWYVARVQRVSAIMGADPAACPTLRVVIEAIVALQGARAMLVLLRDFVARDGATRAALARVSVMSRFWWMQACSIVVGCYVEHLWATHASAAGVSSDVRWLVAAVCQYTLEVTIVQWVVAGQVRRAATSLQRAARRFVAMRRLAERRRVLWEERQECRMCVITDGQVC